MIVLGIDPGSHRTGWGVVQVNGNRLLHVASGVVHGDSDSLPKRLANLADGLDAMLGKYRPEVLSIESIFHAKNSQSALQLGHARGIAVLCAVRAGLSVFEYTPGQIKQATTGRGRAEKEQVQEMVRIILGIAPNVELILDQSDALAAAVCHAQLHGSASGKWQAAIAEAKRAAK
ncbi:MAG: crossover junction endodeoxyribonuclease RuvC [Myxococcota bacterium]|nr:crossover junction endodeoxyribonuclease RuvC [Myxococcota bacterium]